MSARDDALVEAARWLDTTLAGAPVPPLLVVLGLGDGSLLDVLEARAPHTCVLAVEPDPAEAERFRARDWERWFATGRLVYLVDPDYAGADDAWRILPSTTDAPTVLTHPAIARNPGASALRAARMLKKVVFGAQANATARQQFAPKYLTNSLRNAPALLAGHDVRALADVYRGQAAVIAAAGPSLDHTLSALRDVHSRAVLIAVDTALRPLLTTGARPHLVVGLDPSHFNARHFHGLPSCPDTWLVSESALDAAAHRHFGDRTFWFRVANHEPWPWYQTLGLDVGQLEVWGSVVTAAFQVALLAGCDPIVFLGADLAYTGARPYARRTTYEFEWARRVAGGADLEALWQAWTKVHVPVRAIDLHGQETTTSAPLLAFRDWLVAHAARSGRRVINATGAGMFFGAGIEQLSLHEALRGMPMSAAREISRPRVGNRTRLTARTSLASALREVRDDLATGRASSLSSQWAAFSGGGWNPQATLAAVDDALEQLEGEHVAPGAPAAALTSRVLGHLPESVARWRSALLGSEPLPPPAGGVDPGDAPRTLIDAAELLRHIVDAASEIGELSHASVQYDLARTPLSVAYTWPDAVVRDILTFEAYLGDAVVQACPAASFFDRPAALRQSVESATTESLGEAATGQLASALLAMHWAACARSLVDSPSAESDVGLLRTLGRSMTDPDSACGERLDATLLLTTQGAGFPGCIELPVTIDTRRLAAVETGAIWDGDPPVVMCFNLIAGVTTLAVIRADTGSASVSLRVDDPRCGAQRELLRVSPRVLTDEGLPRANIAYVDDRGAVCVSALADHSFVLRADGASISGERWPRALVNELRLGDIGVAAWSSGAIRDGQLEGSYVMFRAAGSTSVSIQELPFRPTWGTWWRGRVYWTCFPTGIGTWSPGQEATIDLTDGTFVAIEPDGDALLLSPGVRDENGYLARRRAPAAWRWRDGPIDVVPLGKDGAVTSRARGSHGWEATAFPEADMVRLDAPGGASLTMRCHYPFKLAWLENSLLVSTLSGELLLFEDLSQLAGPAAVSGSRT